MGDKDGNLDDVRDKDGDGDDDSESNNNRESERYSRKKYSYVMNAEISFYQR
jgi:hypothetical protein